ncbi:unnamed protein product [Linum trigynum]|uniref:Retrotransposon Copia-like N-terminal domain-containing protein n=1 Tax=Linum trigynum TaxID=586398 RepID=A0AAV2DZ20_9ROSI
MVSEPVTMESEKPVVRLSSTNYALWEFQFRVFVEIRGLLGVLDNTTPKVPETDKAQAISTWSQNDARIDLGF